MSSAFRVKAARLLSKIDPPELYLLNRFLHTNKERRIEIEEIIYYLPDPPLDNLNIIQPSVAHIIYFNPGISKSNVSYYTFAVPKTTLRFFGFPKSETDPHEWTKLNPVYYNLNDTLLVASNEIINLEEEIFPAIKILTLKTAELISTTEEISLWENKTAIDKLETTFQLPETVDFLSTFLPEIKKVSLLNSNDFLHETYILDNNKFSLNVDITSPAIRKLNTLQITNDYPMMDYQNLDISTAGTYSLHNEPLELWNVNSLEEKETENLLSKKNSTDLKKYLEPVYELSEEVMSEILFSLPGYQQDGAKFLFHSPFALLCDEFELGKEVQSIMAIKMLFRIRAVRKVLIITSNFQEINLLGNGNSKLENIWRVNLDLLLNGFSCKFYDNSENIFGGNELNNSFVHCINYTTLEEGFIKGTFPHDKLNSFDCVILDDLSEEVLSLDSVKLITKNSGYSYLWILSDFISGKIKDKIKNNNHSSPLNIMERKKDSLPSSSMHRFNYNYFLEADNEVKEKLEEVYRKGQKSLDDLVQFGNLLRLQPNAFQVIQEIQRRGNFISETSNAVKSDLLKYHIKKILERTDRLLIYSQFEKSGLFEIIELLNEIGIEHVSFRQMDSQNDINNKLDLCSKRTGKLVYLTNIKANGIKFKFPKVSHIINFDNWWNPSTRWLLEEKLDTEEVPTTIINYFINETAESKLFFELHRMGLNDKNILDTIPPEKFYQIYDDECWGNFFELPYDIFKYPARQENNINSMRDLVNKVKLFLRFLGYNDITSQAGITNNTHNLSGAISTGGKVTKVIVKCIFSHHLNSEFIKSLIYNIDESGSKVFIITNGKISRSNMILPGNVSLIDGEQLKNYFELFKLS